MITSKRKKTKWVTSSKKSDSFFMDRAVELAWKGRHFVEPNPMVGAVFVKNGKIIAEGHHRRFGDLHAEVETIQVVHDSLRGSSLYVTLEPCCHQGKQGACTDHLLRLGIEKVFYAQLDANPKVSGKGIHILEREGIATERLSTFASQELNGIYNKNLLASLPYVHLKNASTLDGKLSTEVGKGKRLMNSRSFKKVHGLRSRYDAILIGINTLLIDDPQLTARIPGANQPIRVILDTHLKAPKTARVFKEPGQVIVATLQEKIHAFGEHVEILLCKKNPEGTLDLHHLLSQLFKKGIRSVLVEGGEAINTSFVSGGLVDAMTLIFTPHVGKNPHLPRILDWETVPSLSFAETHLEAVGTDLWLTFHFSDPYPPHLS